MVTRDGYQLHSGRFLAAVFYCSMIVGCIALFALITTSLMFCCHFIVLNGDPNPKSREEKKHNSPD